MNGYTPTGMQAMFPIYLPRRTADGADAEDYDARVAQNEVNLNQNLEALYRKLLELEEALSGQ